MVALAEFNPDEDNGIRERRTAALSLSESR
jgi:hypothetical protein